MNKTITPSIICYPGDVRTKSEIMNTLNCSRVHLDMVNGEEVVPDFFRYPELSREERSLFKGAIDFHIFDYERSFEYSLLPCKAEDRVIIHIFPDMNIVTVKSAIQKVKNIGFKVGVALDLDADAKLLLGVLEEVDTVLVMGIQIGGRKLPLSEKAINTIRTTKKELSRLNKKIEVGIDGGVNVHTFDMLLNLTDYIIVGSLLFNDKNLSEKWNQFGYNMLLTSPSLTYIKQYKGAL